MRYLHTMVRVADLTPRSSSTAAASACRRSAVDNDKGRFTLVFLAAPRHGPRPADKAPLVELTHNWDHECLYGRAATSPLAYLC
jgi:lactoylglutathione lyase